MRPCISYYNAINLQLFIICSLLHYNIIEWWISDGDDKMIYTPPYDMMMIGKIPKKKITARVPKFCCQHIITH